MIDKSLRERLLNKKTGTKTNLLTRAAKAAFVTAKSDLDLKDKWPTLPLSAQNIIQLAFAYLEITGSMHTNIDGLRHFPVVGLLLLKDDIDTLVRLSLRCLLPDKMGSNNRVVTLEEPLTRTSGDFGFG
jgi:hypothetical protein